MLFMLLRVCCTLLVCVYAAQSLLHTADIVYAAQGLLYTVSVCSYYSGFAVHCWCLLKLPRVYCTLLVLV